jgi:hypothetical protein
MVRSIGISPVFPNEKQHDRDWITAARDPAFDVSVTASRRGASEGGGAIQFYFAKTDGKLSRSLQNTTLDRSWGI